MSMSAPELRSRDAVVMTETPVCAANPHGCATRRYGPVSSAALELSGFGLDRAFTSTHVERESPRRDAPVMTSAALSIQED